MSKLYIEDERDYGDYDKLEAKVKRRLALDTATVTMTVASNDGELTLDNIVSALEAVRPLPSPTKHVEIDGKRYPVKDFSLQINKEPTFTGMDMAQGPDATILTRWQHKQLLDTFKLGPGWCGWGIGRNGLVDDGSNRRFVPYTLAELRQLRKRIRDKEGKAGLKQIARNPAICQQDPRKLKRLARRKAEELARITGKKATYTVYKHNSTAIKYTTATPVKANKTIQ